MPSFELGLEPLDPVKDTRICVYQHTHAHLSELFPKICMLTYDFEEYRYSELLLLLKTVIGLGDSPVWLNEENMRSYKSENIPGGLSAEGNFEDIPIFAEVYPMIDGREKDRRRGGMFVHIKAGAPVWLKCCTGGLVSLMGYPPEGEEQSLNMSPGRARAQGEYLHITGREHPLHIYIKANAPFEPKQTLDGAPANYGLACFSVGEVWLVAGFSEKEEEALAIAGADVRSEIEKVRAHYENILDNWYIYTPEAHLDEAFMHARLNVEYAWFRPFGWVEALHHWISMWHMEQTAAEEWAGNAERSREIFISQLERLIDGERVPELSAPGFTRMEWGGDNTYFFRGVEHYLKMTGDVQFARLAEPAMRKILAQTFREYDPLKTGVMGFGTQLGNQEDFLATPGPGSGSGCEGAHMLRIMAMLQSLLGNDKEAEKYETYARAAAQKVHEAFWMEDLGRYSWYKDVLGQLRLEAPYHSICAPILYDMIEDSQKASSIDHLLHRLSGPSGEMYISNLFGGHCYYAVSTWGMQCGGNMQYFAAASYARLGMNEQAVRPLKFIADIVCTRHRGAFPETANDAHKAYFSPAACMYSQGIIEGIFGLERDVISNRTNISPCFPEQWEHAEIKIPGVHIKYRRITSEHIAGDSELGAGEHNRADLECGAGEHNLADSELGSGEHNRESSELGLINGAHCFECRLEDDTQKYFLWRLKPYSEIKAFINGRSVNVETTPRCGWFEAEIALGTEREFTLEIQYVPISFRLEKPGCVSEGSEYVMRLEGAELTGLSDPAGIFQRASYKKHALRARIGERLLEAYQPYGWFGMINFARRTFFAILKAGEFEFEYPVHITVLPQYIIHALPLCPQETGARAAAEEAGAGGDGLTGGKEEAGRRGNGPGARLCLEVADYTSLSREEQERELILLLGESVLKTRARLKNYQPVQIFFELGPELLEKLTPGRNKGALLLEGRRREFFLEYRPCRKIARPLMLPEDKLKPPLYWNEIGKCTAPGSTIYCVTPENILQDVFDNYSVLENMPGVPFEINKKGFLPVSSKNERYAQIGLEGVKAKTLYILLSAFITNQHAFSQPFYMELEARNEGEYFPPIYAAHLSFPGNLDIGLSGRGNYGFPTYIEEQPRDALPALPGAEDEDYPQAQPPGYPQHLLWNQFKAFQVGETVFSVIQLELDRERPLRELRVWVQDSNAAMGIYAISAV